MEKRRRGLRVEETFLSYEKECNMYSTVILFSDQCSKITKHIDIDTH